MFAPFLWAFFCVLLPNSPRQLQGKCCLLCWLKCVFTPNEGIGDVWMLGGGEKRRIFNHVEHRFSHHSGGDFHQAINPSQLVSATCLGRCCPVGWGDSYSFGLWLCAEVVGPVIDSWASWASALSNHMFLWLHTENDWKSHFFYVTF